MAWNDELAPRDQRERREAGRAQNDDDDHAERRRRVPRTGVEFGVPNVV